MTFLILKTGSMTKLMKNYNWEYFKSQVNQKLSEPETKKIYSQRKIDVEPVFGFMKAILGFTRMSVRGINKVKRELGFVLMALNIRKIVAQRATKFYKNKENVNFYIISIEIDVYSLIRDIYVPDSILILQRNIINNDWPTCILISSLFYFLI